MRTLRELAEAMAGVWNCPTLVVTRKAVPKEEREALLQDPALASMPPERVARWRAAVATGRTAPRSAEWFAAIRHADAMRSAGVRSLRDAGARLPLGTDTGNPLVIPGRSVHEELQLLVEAGLTPFAALRAAPADAAAFLGNLQDFGTLAVGKRADLLLVRANPLEAVNHVAQPLHACWQRERTAR